MKRPYHFARCAAPTLLAAFCFTTLGADCEGNIVSDPTFRDWCNGELCAWHTDNGAIARVPTWNANDFGVSFVDPKTQISQDTDEMSASCILFTSVANIDPSAEMSVLVDFDIDGTVEREVPIGAARWHRVEIEITAPLAYKGIRFTIRKNGNGTAILAEMRVQATTGCTGPAPVLTALVLGEACGTDAECESGVCGDVVGFRVCTQCSAQHPCATGACTAGLFPFPQCAPGQHIGKTGELCVTSNDCENAGCEGTTLVPLAGKDAGTCDLDALSAGDGSSSPACMSFSNFGVHGGRCR